MSTNSIHSDFDLELLHEISSRMASADPFHEVLTHLVNFASDVVKCDSRFVYVLEGAVKMQVAGGPLLTLGPGQTFYEGPDDIHSVSANASATKPARILVFMIKNVGAPATVPAK